MTTSYVFEELDFGEGIVLYIDGNSKITAGNGTYDEPKSNAFSLPHISTCPHATTLCMKSCYVFGLQKHVPEVYKKYCLNERAIHKILLDASLEEQVSTKLADWITNNCQDGFRWHVSGDVMSYEYALFIANVCKKSPNIRYWIYTRTFHVVATLMQAQNLVVNISADIENYVDAKRISEETGARLCYFTQDGTLPDDLKSATIFPDYNLRGREIPIPTQHAWWQSLTQEQKKMVCPADFFGQSEVHRCGPCNKCMTK
jgi:hypothetical protein